jgi:tricorn protease-like protein
VRTRAGFVNHYFSSRQGGSSMESRVKVIDKELIARKSEEIYQKIKREMEANHKGEFLAIDPESGNYYLAKTSLEAILNGRKEHPNTVFYIIRIGFPYVYKKR